MFRPAAAHLTLDGRLQRQLKVAHVIEEQLVSRYSLPAHLQVEDEKRTIGASRASLLRIRQVSVGDSHVDRA